MTECLTEKPYQMLVVIVNFGLGSRVLQVARSVGISGGTIYLGRGTADGGLMQLFDLPEQRKEIVVLIAREEKVNPAVDAIGEALHLHRLNQGIAFTSTLNNFLGVRHSVYRKECESKGDTETMYEAIFTVVDDGMAEAVVEAAKHAGARGGTIIQARGSGIHEYGKIFAMNIEPEKEMVMFVVETELAENVVNQILKETGLDQPGKGILFSLGVNRTFGLIQHHEKESPGKKQK